jgi:hypothetical protein
MDKQLMKCLIRTVLIFLFCLPVSAQMQIQAGVFGPTGGSSVPGPFNLYVEDFSQGTNGSAPTNTQLCNSFYPGGACPSGASFTITNGASEITLSNAENYTWPAFSLTGGSWANTSTLSGAFAMGTNSNNVLLNYPTAVQSTVSKCTPVYTNWPQTTSASGRIDYDSLLQSSAMFNTMQMGNVPGTSISIQTECGGTQTGGNCTGGEGTNGTMPTSTWQIFCHITNNTSGNSYSAVWNAPTSGSPYTTGTLVANSLVTAISSTTGGTSVSSQLFGSGAGSGAGPSGYSIWAGAVIYCGLSSGQTSCGFPAAPFLQLLNPTDSPGSGNYTTGQTVTVTNPSSNTDTYCYTTCSTAGCTPTAPTASNGTCTSGTTYSGSFTATPPEAVSYIATRNGNQNSSVFTSDYVSPNATYVSSGQCEMNATATCTVSSLSIPSGDIIAAGCYSSGGVQTLTISDSNSDTPSYGSMVQESTDGFWGRVGMMKAGAIITTLTGHQSSTGQTSNCLFAWYSPGTLTGALDKTTGQDQPNTTNWTSGNTTTLSGSADLIVDFWTLGGTGHSSTYSDGSTQRITCSAATSCGLSDRTAWGTPGQAASGTWDANNYGLAMVLAIE